MKSKMKKGIQSLALLALLVAFSGCSNPDPKIKIISDAENQPVYLSMFAVDSILGQDVIKYWSDQFMEQYNRQVYINAEGAHYYEDTKLSYRELLVKRLESSSPDDLYIINAEDVLEFEKKGYWYDLSEMNFVDNISDAALYQSKHNNKVFSVPLSFTGFGYAWNVSMLEEYNLEIPTNYSEFAIVCQTLKEAGILPYGANKGYALTVPAMGRGLSKLYGSTTRDEEITSLNKGETKISHYLKEGYELLDWMIQNEYLNPEQALNAVPQVGDMELFMAGQCAFICLGLGSLMTVELPFEWKMTGLPILDDGEISVYGANNRLCVNPKSKHLDTALEFIEIVGRTDSLDKSAEIDFALSTAKNSEIKVNDCEEKLASLLISDNQIPNQDFSLYFNTWESIRDVARELCKGYTVEEVCEMLDQKQISDINLYTQNSKR